MGKFAEYNSYPKDMKEMDETAWNDFFTYCVMEYENRQAYRKSIYEMCEKLMIFWIRKELNLGFCIGKKEDESVVKFYRIGSDEQWNKFKNGFAASFAGDNS